MTFHPAVVFVFGAMFLALLIAYMGASTRAFVLQQTLNQLWPFVRSVSAALQANANANGKQGTDGQA